MSLESTSKLFLPTKVGDVTVAHRVVMAPLTRFRASDEHVHIGLGVEYYAQRASTPGTLIISEATFISPQAGGYPNVPGIWNDAQIAAWRKITDAVHAKGSFIFMQLWALGRTAYPSQLKKEGDLPYVSASDIALEGQSEKPRPLTEEEIKEYIDTYVIAADNAVHKAGFDGVEVHGANGYLVDQFLQDVSNKRTDKYGGSIENRSRFALEIIAAITKKIGASKTAIRLSPWHTYNGMRMKDPIPTFSYLVSQFVERFPDLAYVHFIEPRVQGFDVVSPGAGETNEPLYEIWKPRPIVSAGGHTRESALKAAEAGQLVAFGRWFISNPDLPERLRKNVAISPYDRTTFYASPGRKIEEGYTDYSFADLSVAAAA